MYKSTIQNLPLNPPPPNQKKHEFYTVVCFFNDLIDKLKQIVWPLAHQASETEKLLGQQETPFVPDDWMHFFQALRPVSRKPHKLFRPESHF